MKHTEFIRYQANWQIKKYLNDAQFALGMPYAIVDIADNLLLNAGITLMLQLLGATAAPTAFSNAAARLGVGDSTVAEVATQTALQAATNKTYKAMGGGYPQVAAQTITWQATFGGTDANYAWQEFTVDNGVTSFNRKVSDQGTKASGQIWVLSLAITMS